MQTAGLFVVFENGTQNYWTSTNGASWTLRTLPVKMYVSSTAMRGIVAVTTGSMFMTDYSSGQYQIWKTTDGINWSYLTGGVSGLAPVINLTRYGASLLGFNSYNVLYLSKDEGITWIPIQPAGNAFSSSYNTGFGCGCPISTTAFLVKYYDVAVNYKVMTVAIDTTKANLPSGKTNDFIRYA
jgi:hypothetical protein